MNEKKPTGNDFKEWIVKEGLSEKEVAEQLGIGEDKVKYWSRMNKRPLPDYLAQLIGMAPEENKKPDGKSFVGQDLRDYLEARKWSVYDAQKAWRIPWTDIRDGCVWPKRKVSDKIVEAVRECELKEEAAVMASTVVGAGKVIVSRKGKKAVKKMEEAGKES